MTFTLKHPKGMVEVEFVGKAPDWVYCRVTFIDPDGKWLFVRVIDLAQLPELLGFKPK
jgi:hypothetical protein